MISTICGENCLCNGRLHGSCILLEKLGFMVFQVQLPTPSSLEERPWSKMPTCSWLSLRLLWSVPVLLATTDRLGASPSARPCPILPKPLSWQTTVTPKPTTLQSRARPSLHTALRAQLKKQGFRTEAPAGPPNFLHRRWHAT